MSAGAEALTRDQVIEGVPATRSRGRAPGITRSDLLVINKIDLAPLVGADLGVMERDAKLMRGERPFVFTNVRAGEGVSQVGRFHPRGWRARVTATRHPRARFRSDPRGCRTRM